MLVRLSCGGRCGRSKWSPYRSKREALLMNDPLLTTEDVAEEVRRPASTVQLLAPHRLRPRGVPRRQACALPPLRGGRLAAASCGRRCVTEGTAHAPTTTGAEPPNNGAGRRSARGAHVERTNNASASYGGTRSCRSWHGVRRDCPTRYSQRPSWPSRVSRPAPAGVGRVPLPTSAPAIRSSGCVEPALLTAAARTAWRVRHELVRGR